MHTPGLLGWVKRSDIEIVQISTLIGFSYDLSQTVQSMKYYLVDFYQDGIRCWINGIYILWYTSSPCDKDSGE